MAGLQGVGDEVVVGEGHALGVASGAAGINNGRQCLGGDVEIERGGGRILHDGEHALAQFFGRRFVCLLIVSYPKPLDELFVDGAGDGRAQIGKHILV